MVQKRSTIFSLCKFTEDEKVYLGTLEPFLKTGTLQLQITYLPSHIPRFLNVLLILPSDDKEKDEKVMSLYIGPLL